MPSLLAMSSVGVIHDGGKLDNFYLVGAGYSSLILTSRTWSRANKSLLASLQVGVRALPQACTRRSLFGEDERTRKWRDLAQNSAKIQCIMAVVYVQVMAPGVLYTKMLLRASMVSTTDFSSGM